METRLKQSAYLQVIPRVKGGYVVYHSLYGNLKKINLNLFELLGTFEDPVDPAALFKEGTGNGIGEAINDLKK